MIKFHVASLNYSILIDAENEDQARQSFQAQTGERPYECTIERPNPATDQEFVRRLMTMGQGR